MVAAFNAVGNSGSFNQLKKKMFLEAVCQLSVQLIYKVRPRFGPQMK